MKNLTPDIEAQLQSLKETLQQTAPTAASVPAEPNKVPVQLPLWPEPKRGGPNALLRSAFFAGIHSKKRKHLGIRIKPEKPLQPVTIAAQQGIAIRFAGDQLNQYDADVFFEALHRARNHPLETECLFRGYSFLKAIGRRTGEEQYEDLTDSLIRLRDGRVHVEWTMRGKPYEFVGGLVSTFTREKDSKIYKVIFAAEIKTLFMRACWTALEWDERQALKGHPLAQWLHSYFSTHAEPFPVSASFLHEKSGSPTKLLKHFRAELKNALATLDNVLQWKAIWEGDLVTITRPPSASQARHLIRNASKKPSRKPKRGEGGLTPASAMLPGIMKKARV